MNKYSLAITESAVKDLKKLQQYLIHNFGEVSANNSLSGIMSNLTDLEQLPNKGKSASSLISLLSGYRYLIVHKNIVFYSIDPDLFTIKIHRIFSTNENFTQKFLYFIQDYEN